MVLYLSILTNLCEFMACVSFTISRFIKENRPNLINYVAAYFYALTLAVPSVQIYGWMIQVGNRLVFDACWGSDHCYIPWLLKSISQSQWARSSINKVGGHEFSHSVL